MSDYNGFEFDGSDKDNGSGEIDEEVRVQLKVDERFYDTVDKCTVLIDGGTSPTKVAEIMLVNNAQDFKNEVYGIRGQIKLMKEYRRKINEEFRVPSFGRKTASLGEEMNRRLAPDVGEVVAKQLTDIGDSLNCSRSAAGRMVMLKSMYGIFNGVDTSTVVSYTDDVMFKWEKIRSDINNIDLEFEMFIRKYFNISRAETLSYMKKYPGSAYDFFVYFREEFMGRKAHQRCSENIGDEYVGMIEDTMDQWYEMVGDTYEWP